MIMLKQSTACTLMLGPFLSDSDGKTALSGLTIQKANVKLSKNGGTKAAASANQGVADAGAPHDSSGDYKISLDATDTNTLGELRVSIAVATALPVWERFQVVPASVYDAMIGGAALATDLAYLVKITKNKRELKKSVGVWSLHVYDDDNVTPLAGFPKVLKDKDGLNIGDLAAGALAQELKLP